MKNYLLLLLLLLPAADAFSQTKKGAEKSGPLTIGSQVWATSNLNTDRFRNGDVIAEAKTEEEWAEADKAHRPAWCYYRNEASRGSGYGKLYNLYAVTDARGLAPAGWHIPTEAEWETLIEGLGGTVIAGPELRNGSFKGIAGSCRYSFGAFNEETGSSYWWSNTTSASGGQAYRIDSKGVLSKETREPGDGLSVRCLKD
jgi:uncharacterized protein (TIGR02145 family)